MRKILPLAAVMAALFPFIACAQYHDAEAFGARGPVRLIQIETVRPGVTIKSSYSFTSEGELVATERGPILSLERDAEGRLTKYVYDSFQSSYYDLDYDEQGRVSNLRSSGEVTTYTYDSQGRIAVETYADYYSEIRIRYNYLSFDDHGNWTRRAIDWNGEEERTETRTIDYWSAASEAANSGEVVELTGPAVSGRATHFIDSRYRELLECTIQGSRNVYRVLLGQTPMASIYALDDVVVGSLWKRNNGEVGRITLGTGETEVTFNASGTYDRVTSVTFSPGSIPESWGAAYGIDRNILQRADRRAELAKAGFVSLSEVPQSYWNYGIENYEVKDGDARVLLLELMTDYGEFYGVRVSLCADEAGVYPQLRDAQSGEGGGFLLKAFSRLAESRNKRQEEAQRLREQSLRRRADAESSHSSALNALSMVRSPFGVLSAPVDYDSAVEALSSHVGWRPDLSKSGQISLSASKGYDLAYEHVIPLATATFSAADGKLTSYDYTFSYIQGVNFPADTTPVQLHEMARELAQKIIAEWEAAGYELRPNPDFDPELFENALCFEDGERRVRIHVTGAERHVPHVFYMVYVNVEMR